MSDPAQPGTGLATDEGAFEDAMPTFTVHVPTGIVDDVERAERTVFVRDAFSLPAFVFGPLFLVYRRLWRAALAWLLAAVALSVLTRVLALPIPIAVLLFLVLAMLVGLEANEARRQALGRRGFIGSALVTGSTRTMAERSFFAGASPTGFGLPAERQGGASAPSPDPAGTRPVIGLFPRPASGTKAKRP